MKPEEYCRNRIGIDLGGTNIAAGLVSEDGKIEYKYKTQTDISSAAAVIEGLADAAAGVMRECGIDAGDIGSIGIACPGAVDTDRGIVEYSANLPLLDTDVRGLLSRAVGVETDRIRVANDADAAALGEYRVGIGRGMGDLLLVTLGTGVGAGYINNGRMLTGHNHSAGEFGHTVIVYGGEPCACGRRGCAERYCSASALKRQTGAKIEEYGRKGIRTLLSELVEKEGKISARTAFAAASMGDLAAAEVVDAYISYLSCMLANFINIFQPEVIAIGGGVSGEGERLLATLRQQVYTEMYNSRQRPEQYTRIECASLGNDAGIVGAAML